MLTYLLLCYFSELFFKKLNNYFCLNYFLKYHFSLTTYTDTYFTRPYTSQDKGTVENRIGVIRRFFPKKADLLLITKNDVKLVERKLNNRPVRKFNYLTPNQVLQQNIALII